MQSFRNTLAYKITFTSLLASGMAVAILLTAFLILDSISSRSSLNARLATLANIVGQNSTAALNFNDRPAAEEVLAALHAEPPIVAACLYDTSDHLFAFYKRDKSAMSCSAVLSQVSGGTRQFPAIIRPVMRHGEFVGTVLLISDSQELQQRWNRLLILASLLLLLALSVSGFAGSVLQRRISKPIADLASAMK